MIEEITAAAAFLTRLVAKSKCLQLDNKVERFQQELVNVLTDKFHNHWFPERPTRGQGFRCLRINENIRRETVIEQVCSNIGIQYNELVLPLEITIWIDPFEVTCRFGEHKGSYCVVADFQNGNKENYVDQINVDELEKKSVERAKQASFDMVNSRKRNQQRNYISNGGYSNSSNGLYSSIDYSNGLQTAPTTSAGYYGQQPHHYYASNAYASSTSPKGSFGSGSWSNAGVSGGLQVATPPTMYASNSYSAMSPTSRGGMNGNGGASGGGYNGYGRSGFMSIGNGGNNSGGAGKYSSRGLHNAFSSSVAYNSQPNDRYHWNNKSIVKA